MNCRHGGQELVYLMYVLYIDDHQFIPKLLGVDLSSWAFQIRVNLQITGTPLRKKQTRARAAGNQAGVSGPSWGKATRTTGGLPSAPLYLTSGLLSALGVNFAFKCPSWRLSEPLV